MAKFYHFTSKLHLPWIEEDGFLKVTDPNLTQVPWSGEHPWEGPGVVWLLDLPEISRDSHGLGQPVTSPVRLDKTAVRFTVDVPDAKPWLDWVKARRHNPEWIKTIVRTGGGMSAAKHWYVVPRPIPRDEWVEVRTDE